MRFVITGASGHIGNNLVRYINDMDREANIISLGRRYVDRELSGTIVTQVVGDISSVDFLKANIRKDDIVIHSAGLIDLTGKKFSEAYNINYVATKNICDVCENIGVKKFIYIGSVDAIYREDVSAIITEPDDYYPDLMPDSYSKTKAMASKYVLDRIKANIKFNANIILPTCVIGVHDYKPSAVGRIVQGIINGKKEIGIKGGYNFVDVMDVCKCIYNCSLSNTSGQYIVSGYNVTIHEFYDKINRVVDNKCKPIIIPDWLVYVVLPFVKVLNKVTLRALKDPHNYTCAKAKKDLGYIATDIDESVREMVEWFINKKSKD